MTDEQLKTVRRIGHTKHPCIYLTQHDIAAIAAVLATLDAIPARIAELEAELALNRESSIRSDELRVAIDELRRFCPDTAVVALYRSGRAGT